MNKKILSLALAFAMILGSFSFVAAEGFPDIPADHWAVKDIEYLAEEGIIEGFLDGTYKPGNNVSRAQLAKIINEALELTEKAEVDFSDVNEGAWYYDHIAMAVEEGYMNGYPNGTMNPNGDVRRQEAAKMFVEAFGVEETDEVAEFLDSADIQGWAVPYVNAAVAAGLMEGHTSGNFAPLGTLTRAEAARLTINALGVEFEDEDLVAAIEAAEAAIEALPAAEELTLENADDVAAARALVDAALELDEDAVIDGLEDLVALEGRIEELEEIGAVEEQLLALPGAADVTVEDEEAIVAARTAYDALSEALAEEISAEALTQLTGAEAAIVALEEDEEEPEPEPEPELETLPGEFERTPFGGLNVIKFDMPGEETEITSVTINGVTTTRFNVDVTEGRVIAEEATDEVIVVISGTEYLIVVA